MVATIKDVAKKAGVSISTVSRVVNKSKPVSTEVKKRVVAAIEELKYEPNVVARSLVTKKSFLIGVIVTDIANSYVAEMVRGIEEVGKMYDYDILLCNTFGDKEMELKYMKLLYTKQVGGIILLSDSQNDDIYEYISDTNIPFVYLNRYYRDDRYDTVRINNLEASYEMTKYLMHSGHENIVFASQEIEENSLEREKIRGYENAMIEENLKPTVYYGKGSMMESGYELAPTILEKEKEATAIFCGYDEMAIGVLGYLYDNEINSPEEISVVGFGDIDIASIYRPTLTTIKVPYYDIGAVSIRRIIKELKGEEDDEKDIVLPFNIIERSSSKRI